MRTEVKFAVVVVLVAVIGAAVYFFRREGDQPIALTSAKLPTQTLAPKVEELPLPLGPSRSTATEKPTGPETSAARPMPTTAAPETPQVVERAKPLVKIDLNPVAVEPSETTASRPAAGHRRSGRNARTGADNVFANKPATIDIDSAGDNATRPSAVAGPTTATVYVVKPNDTLYKIAREQYGRSEMWTVISRANHEVHPGKLRVGQKLTIPPAGKAKSSFDGPAEATVTETAEKTTENKPVEIPAAEPGKGRPYKVQHGDTLHSIARAQLGAGSRWREIKELNKDLLSKPGSLKVGQTIYLPEKSAASEKTTTAPKKAKATKAAAKNGKSAKAKVAKASKARAKTKASPTPAVEEPKAEPAGSIQ